MKQCTKCRLQKPLTDFFVRNKDTGRLHAQCKLCYKEHRTTYYSTHYDTHKQQYLLRAKARREKLRHEFHRNMLVYLANQACFICKEDDIRVLEFDHMDPSEKKFSISQAVKLGYKWEEVLKEIQKCQILCANCHKRRTATQFGWYKQEVDGGADRN